MKKIFPIIICLISLSLLGIIFIQVNWIQNMIKVKEDQLDERVERALKKSGQKLLSLSAEKTFPFKTTEILANPFSGDGIHRNNILSQVTNTELRELISKAFSEEKLTVPDLEYSVSSSTQTSSFFKPELHSPNFLGLLHTGKREYTYPIIPESGSQFEGLVPSEGSIMVIIPNSKITILEELKWMLAGAILFTVIIISAFTLTLRTMLKQKKISEIKSDFINNMTHEFKTPIATISLAVDALKNKKVIGNEEKMNYFTGVIKDENIRMNKQVESILQAALLDKQEIQLNLKNLGLNQMVTKAFEYFTIILEENKGEATLKLNATNDTILADEVHINNLIRNLMDNAIKYTKPDVPPSIGIATVSNKKYISLQVTDNGIGMNKETVVRIFEKFYRAHTGNLHNVKGFGLGLTYVKAVVEAHKGKIKVESTLHKGTTFTIDLPIVATT